MLRVFFHGLAVDQDVVQVNDNALLKECSKHRVHTPLECSWCIGEPERHHQELEVTETRPKCGLLDILLSNSDLVVPTTKINLRKDSGTAKAIKELIYPW
jgi:hypothetical protein